jgi:hypothetical protein
MPADRVTHANLSELRLRRLGFELRDSEQERHRSRRSASKRAARARRSASGLAHANETGSVHGRTQSALPVRGGGRGRRPVTADGASVTTATTTATTTTTTTATTSSSTRGRSAAPRARDVAFSTVTSRDALDNCAQLYRRGVHSAARGRGAHGSIVLQTAPLRGGDFYAALAGLNATGSTGSDASVKARRLSNPSLLRMSGRSLSQSHTLASPVLLQLLLACVALHPWKCVKNLRCYTISRLRLSSSSLPADASVPPCTPARPSVASAPPRTTACPVPRDPCCGDRHCDAAAAGTVGQVRL